MLDLNLLNPELKSKIHKVEILHILTRLYIYLFLLIALLSILLYLSNYLLNDNLEQINASIENENNLSIKQSSISVEEIIKSLNSQLIQIDKIQSNYVKWSVFLSKFSFILPDKVTVNLIELNSINKVFRITGMAIDRAQLLSFQDSLGKFTFVTNLNFPLSNLSQQKDINFEISGQLTEKIYE